MEKAFIIIGFTRSESRSNVPFAAILFIDKVPDKKMLVNLGLGDIQTVEHVQPASPNSPNEPTLYMFHRLPQVNEITLVRIDDCGNRICPIQKVTGDPAMLIPRTIGSATERLFNARGALSAREFHHMRAGSGESERLATGSRKRRT